MKVWVFTKRNDYDPNITIEVYSTRAAANQRLRYEVESFFEKPFDEIKEIPDAGYKQDYLYISADYVEYYNNDSGTTNWDVDEREVIATGGNPWYTEQYFYDDIVNNWPDEVKMTDARVGEVIKKIIGIWENRNWTDINEFFTDTIRVMEENGEFEEE